MPTDVNKAALAAAWATSNISAQDWNWLCQRFVENAYGTSGQFFSAQAAGNALITHPYLGIPEAQNKDPLEGAEVGDLVFFAADETNRGFGHVGIYVGNGEMVSATAGGVKKDHIFNSPYWANRFRGWGDAPDAWKGRESTPDLLTGANAILSRANAAANNPMPTTPLKAEYERQLAEARAKTPTLDAAVQSARRSLNLVPEDVRVPDNPKYTEAQKALEKAEDALAENQKQVSTLSTNIAKIDSETTDAGRPVSGTVREQGGKVFFFPSDGTPARDVTPEGWEAATPAAKNAQTVTAGNQVFERQADGSWKSVIAVEQPPKPLHWVNLPDKIIGVDPVSGNTVTSIAKTPDTKYVPYEGRLYQETPQGLQLVLDKDAPGANLTDDQKRLQGTQADTADANLRKLTFDIEREEARKASGYWTATDEANLTQLKAQAQTAQITAAEAQRRQDSGFGQKRDEQTLTGGALDNAIKANTVESGLFQNEKNKEIQRLGKLVASGELDAKTALAQLGEFTSYLTAQHNSRVQDEVERRNRATEQQARDTESRNLMELATKTASDAGMGAIVGNLRRPFDPNAAATQVQVGGDPSLGVGTRLLMQLGMFHSGLPGYIRDPYEGAVPEAPVVAAAPESAPPSHMTVSRSEPPPATQPAAVPEAIKRFQVDMAARKAAVAPAPDRGVYEEIAEDLGNGMAQNYIVNQATGYKVKSGDAYTIPSAFPG